MKKNRSHIFTTGLCNTFSDSEDRLLFFELDSMEHFDKVIKVYREYEIDFLYHKTGSGGVHFLSPTMITKYDWKLLMNLLKDINPKCPMTTLRMEPNKYPNESETWYRHYMQEFGQPDHNSYQACIYINKIWKTEFVGIKHGTLKIVRYPLPLDSPILKTPLEHAKDSMKENKGLLEKLAAND